MPSFTRNDIQQTLMLLRNSKEEDDIIAALDILGAVQWVGAVPDIMAHIKDPRPDVKAAIEATLLAIGQEAIPVIVEYLPKIEPQYHVSLQSLVESFWKGAGADKIHMMMNHEDNRVRWAMAWTLAKPLRTIPPEDIAYIFEGLEDESLTAIRWAATQSLMTLASSEQAIPPQLIQVALPVMVDNFKYGDMNLSESSVQAISLLVSPPHPAITAMLRSSDADLQVASIKVLTAWVEDGKALDEETVNAFKFTIENPTWRAENEISRLHYVLSMSNPELLEQLENTINREDFEDEHEDTEVVRATQEIMLPPLKDTKESEPVSDEEADADDEDTVEIKKTDAFQLNKADPVIDETSNNPDDQDTVEIKKTDAFQLDKADPVIDETSNNPDDQDTVEIPKNDAFQLDEADPVIDETSNDQDTVEIPKNDASPVDPTDPVAGEISKTVDDEDTVEIQKTDGFQLDQADPVADETSNDQQSADDPTTEDEVNKVANVNNPSDTAQSNDDDVTQAKADINPLTDDEDTTETKD